MTVTQLPYDVVRHILLFLCSQRDLVNAGEASVEMQAVVSDGSLWRDLCSAHFSPQQRAAANYCLQRRGGSSQQIDWFDTYSRLYR